MNLGDLIVSGIRTLVPVFVGGLLMVLTDNFGIEIDSTALTTVVTGLVISGYYALARLLEARFPFLGGILLGIPSAPSYKKG